MASSTRISEMLKIDNPKALTAAFEKFFRDREKELEPELNDAEIVVLLEAFTNTEIEWTARSFMWHILAMQKHAIISKWAFDQLAHQQFSAAMVGPMKYVFRHHPDKRDWLKEECADKCDSAVLFHLGSLILREQPELAFEYYYKAAWLNDRAYRAGLELPGQGIVDEMYQALSLPEVNKPSVWKVIEACEKKYGFNFFR